VPIDVMCLHTCTAVARLTLALAKLSCYFCTDIWLLVNYKVIVSQWTTKSYGLHDASTALMYAIPNNHVATRTTSFSFHWATVHLVQHTETEQTVLCSAAAAAVCYAAI